VYLRDRCAKSPRDTPVGKPGAFRRADGNS